MPAETGMWGAIGNGISCDIQGFLTIFGCNGTVLYSLSLTIYFLLVIRYELPDATIKKRVEPYLHAVPILFALTTSIYILATNNFNPAGTVCWVAAEPAGCEHDNEVDCVSKGNVDTLKWVSVGVPLLSVFGFNCIMLALILWTAYHKTMKSQSYGKSWITTTESLSSITHVDNHGRNVAVEKQNKKSQAKCSCNLLLNLLRFVLCRKNEAESKEVESSVISPLAARFSRKSKASILRLQEVSNRAMAYIIGYLLTFLFSALYRIIIQTTGAESPFAIIFLSRLLFPLQGFFNVMVFTYPHVSTYRKKHPGYSYLHALWEVVKSGGDNDEVRPGRASRRNSLRKQQKVLEQVMSKNRKGGCFDEEDPMSSVRNGILPPASKSKISNKAVVRFPVDSKTSMKFGGVDNEGAHFLSENRMNAVFSEERSLIEVDKQILKACSSHSDDDQESQVVNVNEEISTKDDGNGDGMPRSPLFCSSHSEDEVELSHRDDRNISCSSPCSVDYNQPI